MLPNPIQQRLRILCISPDQRLLETRGAVLATRYELVTVASIEDIHALAIGMFFSAVVRRVPH
jgi:hypothetical protein